MNIGDNHMRYTVRSLIAALLCLCIYMSLAVPALAASESNSEGITFSASLDKTALTVSESAQTVTMSVTASKAMTLNGIGGTVAWSAPVQLQSIGNADGRISYTDGDVNLDNGKFGWSTANTENIENVTSVAEVTFTVPANTPAGTYRVGVNGLNLSRRANGSVGAFEDGAMVSASFTISEAGEGTDPTDPTDPPEAPAQGYTVALSTLSPTPIHETSFDVEVAVTHSEENETHFAAGQFHITYDHTALTLNSITPKQQGSNMTTNSVGGETATTVKVADFGADKLLGSGIYTLNFTALTPGQTTLTLSDAGITTKENATANDLVTASCGTALNVNVLKKTFAVTLPDYGFVGDSTTVTDGDSFTFRISDPYYDYGTVYATMGDGEPVALTPNEDGSYTVHNVTGKLSITTEKMEPRSYEVEFVGEYESGEATATYMTDYPFSLKENKEADATKGHTYSLKSVTIDGKDYTGYTTVDGRTYTIPGKDIKGKIVITIEKIESDPAYVSVTYTGHPGSVVNKVDTIPYGSDYTLTLDKISGYHYTVTATMGGTAVEVLVNEDGTYTIKNVTGDLVIHIERTVNTEGVSISHYLTLDGSSMYLILKNPAQSNLDEKYIPTYDGNPMYWSSRYNAYCYLIISAETIDLDAEKQKIELVALSDTVTKAEVQYDMDVNLTSKVDAADAQLVYNMYSHPTVTEFTEELSMMKFLKADVVGDGTSNIVDTNDAVAIINAIVGANAAE